MKLISFVGLLAGLGMAASGNGSVPAEREVARLSDEAASLKRRVEVLRSHNGRLVTDPGEPVALSFVALGSKTATIDGLLPLQVATAQ